MFPRDGSDRRVLRPLLLSYGGGHANIMIALARELAQREVGFDLIGLTTGYRAFERAGLAPHDVTALLDAAEDARALASVLPFLPAQAHPDITQAQTHAYFALGFADLASRFGEAEALRLVGAEGRKAFEPKSAFARYFSRRRPSVLVTTTSPRFELAAIRAARECGITSLAVGDHFLVGETASITSGYHADHLVVLADAVAERLRARHRPLPKLHVLGNPAFDVLAPCLEDAVRREALRERLGLTGKFAIFWPLGGAPYSGSGERLLPAEEVAQLLEMITREASTMRYLLRSHPNWPVEADLALQHGQWSPADLSPEDCLLASDLVVAESTTLGLQALLRGIPVIAFGHADLTQYPHFGWASLARTPAELAALVLRGDYIRPPAKLAGMVGQAGARTADLIEKLHAQALNKMEHA